MTEYMYRSVDHRKHSPTHHAMKTPDVSNIEARDNPPTTTKRGAVAVDAHAAEDNMDSQRTIEKAVEYIQRLESNLKTKAQEHKFLKQRLEKAVAKNSNPSVASWQNSEHDILA